MRMPTLEEVQARSIADLANELKMVQKRLKKAEDRINKLEKTEIQLPAPLSCPSSGPFIKGGR